MGDWYRMLFAVSFAASLLHCPGQYEYNERLWEEIGYFLEEFEGCVGGFG